MNKTILYIIMAVVLVQIAAAGTYNQNITWGSHMNPSAWDDAKYLNNASNVHANSSMGKGGTANTSYIFSYTDAVPGNGNFINFSNASRIDDNMSDMTVVVWINLSNTLNTAFISKPNVWSFFVYDVENRVYFEARNETGAAGTISGYTSVGVQPIVGTWEMWVATYNSSTGFVTIWRNTTVLVNVKGGNGQIGRSNTPIMVGRGRFTDYEYGLTGGVDEAFILNKTVIQSEVDDFYAMYDGWNGTASSGAAPGNVQVTILYPTNNESFNRNTITINSTCVESNASHKYYRYVDGVINSTAFGITESNGTIHSTNINFLDAYHNITIKCNYTDATGVVQNGSANVSFWVDTAAPQVSSIFGVASGVYVPNNQNVSGQFNLSDTNALYSYNLSIDGTQMAYLNQINVSAYSLNFSRSASDLIPTKHSIVLRVADGHTKKEIPDYQIDLGSHHEYLKYIFPDNLTVKISLVGGSIFDHFETSKEYDRYNWTFYPKTNASEYTFEVKADSDIFTIDDGTTRWLIVDDKWIDFNLINEPDAQVSLEYKSPSKIYVTVSGITNPGEQFYHSIGELNIVYYNYTFYTINATLGYASLVFRGEPTTITLGLNMTNLSLWSANASLIYNYTDVGPGNFTSIGQNYGLFTKVVIVNSVYDNETFSYHFNLTNSTGNFSGNFYVNGTHHIIEFSLTSNCSQKNNVTTVNITIFNEDNPVERFNATVLIDSIFWITSKNNTGNYTVNLSHASSYLLCLAANGTTGNYTVYADMIIFNSVEGGFTHRNYYFNMTLNENVTNISLYNFNYTTGISELRVTTRKDTDYSYYKDAVISFERRYVDEGLWRTVQMGLSDDFGNSVFDIKEKTTDYRLTFRDIDNHLLYQSNRMLFSCDLGICALIFKLTQWTAAMSNPNLIVSSSYDNETKMLTVTWSDDTFLTKSVWVQVTKPGPGIELCSQTVASPSGTINCNLSLFTGEVLLNVYAEDPVPVLSEFINLAQQLFSAISSLPRTERALWAGGIMMTVGIAGVAFGAAIGVIMTIVGVALLVFLNLFNAVTITVLIIMAVLGIAIGINVRR